MKKFYLKKVNPTMVEQLVNYENYKIKALAQMTDDIKEYITKNYGDLETWLTTQIEATINILKNK
jgi:hypothetical protein